MRIPLNMKQSADTSSKAAQEQVLEHDILATKRGDWDARRSLNRHFQGLISTLASKRTDDPMRQRTYLEAGQEGLNIAAKRYKKNIGADRFHIFALDFIQAAMDGVDKPEGFLSRLFRRG